MPGRSASGSFAGGHFDDIAAWMQEVAVQKCSVQAMRDFAGNRRFTAAGYAHQYIDVVIVVSRAQGVLLLGTKELLRVTVIGNIVLPGKWISNNHSCRK